MKNKSTYLFFFLFLIILLNGCNIQQDMLAPVDSIDILIAESFPVQVFVKIEGYLPTPCYQISRIEKYRQKNIFYITIMMNYYDDSCIELVVPYTETVSLEVYGLPAGTYQVNVNGVVNSFALEIDNILPNNTIPDKKGII